MQAHKMSNWLSVVTQDQNPSNWNAKHSVHI